MKKTRISEGWYFQKISSKTGYLATGAAYEKIDLPHDYQIKEKRDPSLTFRTGYYPDKSGRYVKHLNFECGKHYILDVDGAYANAHVNLNESFINMHHHGYTPFLTDLTDYIIDGITNKLVITTDPLSESTRWYSGNGIYRDVFLWEGGDIRIEPRDIFITTDEADSESAAVNVAYTVTSDKDGAVRIEIRALEGGVTVASSEEEKLITRGKNGEYNTKLTVTNPKLWSTDTPELYTLNIGIYEGDKLTDESEMIFGIRTVSISAKTGLLLNGAPIKLRGGNIHHDHGDLGAASYPAAEERKIRLLKDAGFNAIRTSHNPPSTALLEACDKLGMIVMDEAFDMWVRPKGRHDYHLFFRDHCLEDIKEMVLRDRAHPCVFSYSIGNEIPEITGHSNYAEYAKMLADEVRKYDSTRPVTSGIQKDFVKNVRGEDIDPEDYRKYTENKFNNDPRIRNTVTKLYEDALDIVGLNYYREYYELEHEMYPDRVFWASETRAIYFYESWSKTKDAPHILGDFTWTAFDNLGEAGAGRFDWTDEEIPLSGAPYPWRSCYQGDHDLCGYRRPQSYFREAIWLGNKEPRIFTTHPMHFGECFRGTEWHFYDVRESWTYPEEYVGKDIKAEVYTDAEAVDWYVNGSYIGRSETKEAISAINTKYIPGSIRAVAVKGGKEVSEYTLKSSHGCEQILLTPETCQFKADGRDLCYVRVSLTDKDGIPYVTDERHLCCEVSAGKLLAFFSGDPKTEIPADIPECDTHHGKAIAVISAKEPCEIKITVKGDGLPQASTTVKAI